MSKFLNSLNKSINNAKLLVNDSLIQVNQKILSLFNHENINSFSKIILNYFKNNSGKQLRPLLFLLTYNAICAKKLVKNTKYLINLAAFVEIIHLASILHDDVLDQAKLRRSQQAMHVSLGNKFTILAGDLIYSKAFKLINNINHKNSTQIKSILTETVNCMVEGEIMQYLEKYNFSISEYKYLEIINAKTAKLFEAITQIIALLANDNIYINKLKFKKDLITYGLNFGIAYQLLNDLEDFYANGEDIINGIITLPIIFVLNKKNININKKIINIIKQQAKLNSIEQKQQLKILQKIIFTNGGRDYTINLANNYLIKAIQSISVLKNSNYQQAIINIIKSCIYKKAYDHE